MKENRERMDGSAQSRRGPKIICDICERCGVPVGEWDALLVAGKKRFLPRSGKKQLKYDYHRIVLRGNEKSSFETILDSEFRVQTRGWGYKNSICRPQRPREAALSLNHPQESAATAAALPIFDSWVSRVDDLPRASPAADTADGLHLPPTIPNSSFVVSLSVKK